MSTPIKVPEMGESIVEATVTRWLKKEGDAVAVGDVLLELETEKVNLEVGSDHAGILTKIERGPGQDVRVGDILGHIEESGARPAPQEPPQQAEVRYVPPEPPRGQAPGMASDIDMTEQEQRPVQETAPRTPRMPEPEPPAQPTPRPAQEARPVPPPAPEPEEEEPGAPEEEYARPAPPPSKITERVRMSRRRRTIARNLVAAQQTAAILTTFNEIDMTAVMDIRNRHKESFKKQHGVNLGITSFFVKAVIGALKTYPKFNAEVQGDEIVYKHFFDIGVAIDTEDGLIVPVLRDADRMSFIQIEQAIKHFVDKAQKNELSIEDLRGGCFTITNGGIFGSLLSTPILNPPQVGILGLHRIEERPIAVAGQVVIHPMMYVALSYDHRLIDGRDAVQFLKSIKELIEDPGALLLEAY